MGRTADRRVGGPESSSTVSLEPTGGTPACRDQNPNTFGAEIVPLKVVI